MNVLPTTTTTVASWTFQGTLLDSGPNGLNLQTLDNSSFPNAPGGTEQYTTVGNLQGFLFDGNTRIWAPLTSLLQFTGDMTFEWFGKLPTAQGTWFSECPPTGRSGGFGADRIGSMYTVFWGAGGPAYTSDSIGSNIPTSTYGEWLGVSQTMFGIGAVHAYTFRRLGGYVDWFVDGVKMPGTVTDLANPLLATSRLFIGGTEGDTFGTAISGTIIGAMRVSSIGIPDGDVGRDAHYMLGAPVSTETGIVYDGVAAAQFATSLRQAPRK